MAGTTLATQQKKAGIAAYMGNPAVKQNIEGIVGKDNAVRFISSVVSAVQTNANLAQCTNTAIMMLMAFFVRPAYASNATYSTLDGNGWVKVDDNTWTKSDSQGNVIVTLKTQGNVWKYYFHVDDPDAVFFTQPAEGADLAGQGRKHPGYPAVCPWRDFIQGHGSLLSFHNNTII